MFLGIDLGTSAVKVLLLGADDRVLAQKTLPIDVSRPRPLWSEQDPEAWWTATDGAVRALAQSLPGGLAGVEGIGLSGQMHGATLLGASDEVLRPAILWNDGRSEAECRELESREPSSRDITGNLAMPGFTAPKLLWTERHEPDVFERVEKVLTPKDYLRLRITGDHATDLSDASGTLWVDVRARQWSDAMLDATHLERRHMPSLFEGPEATGTVRAELARAWGIARVPVAAGGGDQAAGAAGAGVVRPGEASLSLGTSGVYFIAGREVAANPERAVHAFCHCLPNTWHQMSVILSAASCLEWVARLTGARDVAALLADIEELDRPCERLLFLPYLSGERTPHNDPNALGVFFGLDHDCDAASLGRAVLEGVAFAFADGQAALREAGGHAEEVSVIGGGARSFYWGRILASALAQPLVYRSGAEVGPALGAARLARAAARGESAEAICTAPPVERIIHPDPGLQERYAAGLERYRDLYRTLRPAFASHAESGEAQSPARVPKETP